MILPLTDWAHVVCSPSLALTKYWGKLDTIKNLPATPSIAISLDAMQTSTLAYCSADLDSDLVIIGGVLQPKERFSQFFEALRQSLNSDLKFAVDSKNSFPTASGLASSSSGFAALVCACVKASGIHLGNEDLSKLARLGSASAARAIYGGFTVLDAGAEYAVPLHSSDFWPELRVLAVRVRESAKTTSSRSGMEHTKCTSPYYAAWLEDAKTLFPQAITALQNKDLEQLGPIIRASYLRMFATMLAANPPLEYWQAESILVRQICNELRVEGIQAWETMDAGPQVKIFCLEKDLLLIEERIKKVLPSLGVITDKAGPGPRYSDVQTKLDTPSNSFLDFLKKTGITIPGRV